MLRTVANTASQNNAGGRLVGGSWVTHGWALGGPWVGLAPDYRTTTTNRVISAALQFRNLPAGISGALRLWREINRQAACIGSIVTTLVFLGQDVRSVNK